ncbi:MAG: tRNA (adenosine(37)-N6)-threonylcarbamoyltransferase complex ATPase subunit type 1 TsaE, partial [Cyanobacteria bacterium]|nr:tRNA (adenosine(37)-N6)-threonylcarbamoyltransferase complex ATPase subunit type 1 TsaE [Cyanobacteriota bacterium]
MADAFHHHPPYFEKHYPLNNLEATQQVALEVSEWLHLGDVILFDAPMGSGKTTFTSFLGKHLGIEEPVVSPTFGLIHEYPIPPQKQQMTHQNFPPGSQLVHVDLYRLGPETADSLTEELHSILDEKRSIVVVEWAEYATFFEPSTCIHIKISLEKPSDSSNQDLLEKDLATEVQRTLTLQIPPEIFNR